MYIYIYTSSLLLLSLLWFSNSSLLGGYSEYIMLNLWIWESYVWTIPSRSAAPKAPQSIPSKDVNVSQRQCEPIFNGQIVVNPSSNSAYSTVISAGCTMTLFLKLLIQRHQERRMYSDLCRECQPCQPSIRRSVQYFTRQMDIWARSPPWLLVSLSRRWTKQSERLKLIEDKKLQMLPQSRNVRLKHCFFALNAKLQRVSNLLHKAARFIRRLKGHVGTIEMVAQVVL